MNEDNTGSTSLLNERPPTNLKVSGVLPPHC
jgi:hypothetical protein